MKKLTKKDLDSMLALLPVLEEDEQREIVGGTGAISFDDYPRGEGPSGTYTLDQVTSMVSLGIWNGGEVTGIGFVSGISIVTGWYTLTGVCPEEDIRINVQTMYMDDSFYLERSNIMLNDGESIGGMFNGGALPDNSTLGGQNIDDVSNFSTIMDNMDTLVGTLDELGGDLVKGWSHVSKAVSVLNIGSKAYAACSDGEFTKDEFRDLLVDGLLIMGGAPATAVSLTWGGLYDAMFKDLVKQGEEYVEELESKIKNGSFIYSW